MYVHACRLFNESLFYQINRIIVHTLFVPENGTLCLKQYYKTLERLPSKNLPVNRLFFSLSLRHVSVFIL